MKEPRGVCTKSGLLYIYETDVEISWRSLFNKHLYWFLLLFIGNYEHTEVLIFLMWFSYLHHVPDIYLLSVLHVFAVFPLMFLIYIHYFWGTRSILERMVQGPWPCQSPTPPSSLTGNDWLLLYDNQVSMPLHLNKMTPAPCSDATVLCSIILASRMLPLYYMVLMVDPLSKPPAFHCCGFFC